MTKLFVSYSRKDWAVAEGLVENLSDLGYDVWIDTRIGSRVPFGEEIEKALQGADVVIVIWTPHSIRSDWVRWEAGEALNRGRLLQLRVKDIPESEIPPPFSDYDILAEGEIEDVKRRIEKSIDPAEPHAGVTIDNPKPARPHAMSREAAGVPASSRYVLPAVSIASVAALVLGLVGVLVLLAYSLYFSVSRFADRFGRLRVVEALMVGVLAGAFAGVVGGHRYAERQDVPLLSTSVDLFAIKYVRVIVISTVVGMALSFLLVAMLRYARLRDRNLGPAWSRRRIFWSIAIPAALTVALTVGTVVLADHLPEVGQVLYRISGGYISWIGSGQCPSIRDCVEGECRKCLVGDMSRVDIAVVLGTYLWTMHIYHLRQAGGRLMRMLVSSAVLTGAVLAFVFLFQIFPELSRPPLSSWDAILFSLPWLLLVVISVGVIYLNARSIE
jgi:hypothetical protein